MFNLDELKVYISKIAQKYEAKSEDLIDLRNHSKLEKGILALEEIMELSDTVQNSISEGQQVISGTYALARRKKGYSLTEDDEKPLKSLETMYYGEKTGKGIGSIVKKVLKKQQLTLREGLILTEKVAGRIPGYVNNLSLGITRSRKDLSELRDELRRGIEDLINEKAVVEIDVNNLNTYLTGAQDSYDKLESVRVENSSEGKSTDPEIIRSISQYELFMGEGKDLLQEVEGRRKSIDGNVKMMNSQIGKIGEMLNLVYENQQVAQEAKNFVNVQVPYVVTEVRAQISNIRALSGINHVTEFLESQSRAAKMVNDRIEDGLDHVRVKLDKVIKDIQSSDSIYLDDGKYKGRINSNKSLTYREEGRKTLPRASEIEIRSLRD